MRMLQLVWVVFVILCSQGCVAAGGGAAASGPERGGVDTGRPSLGDEDTGELDADVDPGPLETESADAAVDAEAADTENDATADIEPADTEPATDTAEPPVDDNCEQLTAVAERTYAPVDIIWAIDTSGSMGEEAAILQSQMNAFAAYFETVSLDYRVIVIADVESGTGIDVCVPPPLAGSPSCPESDGPRYRRIRHWVGSTDALEVIDAEWNNFADFLRPDAETHFIVVSDDESQRDAAWFRVQMAPRLPGGFTFHSIVSLTESEDCFLFFCDTIGCSGPNGSAEARGSTYIDLSGLSGGVAASICDAEWTPIFAQIAEGVVRGAGLACSYAIPAAPFGEIVYESVRVEFLSADGTTRVAGAQVAGVSACSSGDQWYYDNNAAPTTIELCPNACGDRAGSIEIFFDCIKV